MYTSSREMLKRKKERKNVPLSWRHTFSPTESWHAKESTINKNNLKSKFFLFDTWQEEVAERRRHTLPENWERYSQNDIIN